MGQKTSVQTNLDTVQNVKKYLKNKNVKSKIPFKIK